MRTPAEESELRPVPTIEDLAQAVKRMDETLSEVLVLLYHVLHDHQDLVESLREEREAVTPPVRPKPIPFTGD